MSDFPIINYIFISRYANIGRPGCVHDATVLRDSNLSLFMNNINTEYHIIGDGAFPLLNWLMKPFIRCRNFMEEHFNYRLSRARMTIENTFGRLKGRWRILLKTCEYSLRHTKLIVKACIILHNVCEDQKEIFHSEWINSDTTIEYMPQPQIVDRAITTARVKRDMLVQSVCATVL